MRIKAKQAWSAGWGEVRESVTIDVDQDRIVRVQHDKTDSEPADVVTDCTVLPGFIDCHEHIGIDVGDEHAQATEEPEVTLLRGAVRLRTMVEGGVTTIRDCGERADVERFWIQALATGELLGPRVVRSVTPICRTGGHAWYLSRQADGVDNIRAAVRQNVRDGAHFIKAMVTGGLSTMGSAALAPEFSATELTALIEEAHRLGRKVAGHAYGGDGVDWALAAGIDSIEHGALLSNEQLEVMAQQGTFLVLTTAVIGDSYRDPRVPQQVRDTMAGVVDDYKKTIERALSAGVRIALGSDCVHGRIDREVLELIERGASPDRALCAASTEGADLAGLTNVGRIEPDQVADLLFVSGNPLEDPATLSEPVGVLASGNWALPLRDRL